MLLLAFVVVAGSATLRTSATFDEIIFPAAGARGYATGDFTLIHDHTPVMQYVYGLPLRFMDVRYPPESRKWSRYSYAQVLLWGSGNAPDKIIFLSRMVGVLLGGLLVVAVYLCTREALGAGGALFAAALVALLPDVLGHAGVTYNDLPIALALFLAVHALDRAVRLPSLGHVALAASLTALAVGVKTTALAALPILCLLVAAEAASGRWRDAAWRRRMLLAVPLFAVVFYAVMVAIYLGDFRLEGFRTCLAENLALDGARRPALLLGHVSRDGFWYFYPVVFLLKTPAALHGLLLLAAGAAVLAWRGRVDRTLLLHPLRGAAVATLVLVGALLASKINIGFRHALPALPFACVLIAAGIHWLWVRGRRPARVAIAVMMAANALSVLAAYPHFLPYLSEYVRHRPVYTTLVDSSTDWGQGLVALRDFMRQRGMSTVYLGYFGSALPEGYGIRYASMPSFFSLPPHAADGADPPRHIAVSSTLLSGTPLPGPQGAADPYAELRSRQPLAVLAGSIYVFELP